MTSSIRSVYGLLMVGAAFLAWQFLSRPGQQAFTDRMLLTTDHFYLWAPQQLSPAMYSGANIHATSNKDEPLDAVLSAKERNVEWLNHFPTRSLIWATRGAFPFTGKFGYYQSTYRGASSRAKLAAKPAPEGGWRIELLEKQP
jgi:hypothetical protein